MIKIILADDHQMFLDGLIAFLSMEHDIEIKGIALNGNQVKDILKRESIDIVVLDIEMGSEPNGIETTKWIKQNYPKTKVLTLTMHGEKELILQLLRVGTSGYILKNKSKEELVHAIHQLASGKNYFPLHVMDIVANTPIKKEKEETVLLTPREQQVLYLIAEGLTTKQISYQLKIKVSTVETHRKNLRTKTKCYNDNLLVRYAIKHGYVDL